MKLGKCVYELWLKLKMIPISHREKNAWWKWGANRVEFILKWSVVCHYWDCVKWWCLCKCRNSNKFCRIWIPVPLLHIQSQITFTDHTSEKKIKITNKKRKINHKLSRIHGPRRLLTVRWTKEGCCLNQTTANQPGRGKIRWEVSVHKQRALITPNHGIFEAYPLNPQP